MPTYTEEWVMSQWIYETLNVSGITDLAVGGVHRGFVPPSTMTHPYITYDPVPSENSDLYSMNSQPLVEVELVWDIRAIGTGLQGEVLNKIAALMFGFLNAKSAVVSSGKINHCRRIGSPVTRPEADEGITFLYSVSNYSIGAKAT